MSSIATKLIAIAQSEQKVYKAGYDKGYEKAEEEIGVKTEVSGGFLISANGEYSYTPNEGEVYSSVKVTVAVPEALTGDLTAEKTDFGYCPYGGEAAVGLAYADWICENSYYNIYGYALSGVDGQQLKLTGAELRGSFTEGANQNILFVTGFKNSNGGTCVIDSSAIVASPASWEWDNPPSEVLITVPSGLNVDGVYISVSNSGTPVLEVYNEAADAAYDKGYLEGYADGYLAGSGSGSGSGTLGTDVTALFGSMSCWLNTTEENSYSLYMAGESLVDGTLDCRYGTVTAGEKYQVHCIPMNPDNLWENFLLANDDYSTLAVQANDASVGQYVKKASNGVYDITIPDDCEMLHINYFVSSGIKIYLIE